MNDNTVNWGSDHRPMLIQLAYSKVNDYQIAEDLVQDTFLSAWKAKDRFRGDCSEKTYLFRILNNKITDFYRMRARKPTITTSQLDNDEESYNWTGNRIDNRVDLNPVYVAETNDFMSHLNRAVENLPGKMGDAFRLWEVEDRSTQEVTRELGITDSNLWVLIHRAKKALRIELGSEWRNVSFAIK